MVGIHLPLHQVGNGKDLSILAKHMLHCAKSKFSDVENIVYWS
jgi:hypothetical protein